MSFKKDLDRIRAERDRAVALLDNRTDERKPRPTEDHGLASGLEPLGKPSSRDASPAPHEFTAAPTGRASSDLNPLGTHTLIWNASRMY